MGKTQQSFLHLPVGPRFAHLYGTVSLAQVVEAHTTKAGDQDNMLDIKYSPMLKSVSKDVRTKLQLSTDGMNPRYIRYRVENLMIIGIIPGIGKRIVHLPAVPGAASR